MTRAERESHTTLDLTITVQDKVLNHGQFSVDYISFHDLIYLSYSLKTPKFTPKYLLKRDLSSLNDLALLAEAAESPWETIRELADLDQKVELFNELIIDLFNRLAPERQIRVTRPPAPWMTENIKALKSKREAALRKAKRTKNENDKLAYRTLRNRTKQEIRNAKRRHIRQATSNLSTRLAWSNLRQFGIGKAKGDHLGFDLDAEELNQFFCNLGGNVDDLTKANTINDIIRDSTQQNFDKFKLTEVTEDEVKQVLCEVSSNAKGSDNIPIIFIHKLIPVILPILTHIFNFSITNNTFPSAWKSSIVLPLPKVKSPVNVSQCRPINILPAVSKALEKIVKNQMTVYLKRHD